MRLAFLLAASCTVAVPALAQQDNLVSLPSATTGILGRGYRIKNVQSTHQFAIPFAVEVPIGQRFSLDVGTYYASTTTTPDGGSGTTLSGLTDTQVRGSYVIGHDALVTSIMVNLPTGKEQTMLNRIGVAGTAASNFLAFPVNTYGTGTSVTGAAAVAVPAGGWTVGAAGSLRYTGEYQPFSDQSLKYRPGVEGRIRLGADRLIGESRLTMGFTFSTFGNDEFKQTGGTSQYQPGNRYIGEAGYASRLGTGTLNLFAWDYYRAAAGGSAGANKENILAAGAMGSWPVGGSARLEPVIEARFWSPQQGSGTLLGGGATLQIPMGADWTVAPGGRVDIGSVKLPAGQSDNLLGWGVSLMVSRRL